MIQQHLVLHYTSPDDDVTYYEADWESAFALARAGKVIELAQEHFGETAAEVTSDLLLQGHAAIGDLVAAYSKAFKNGWNAGQGLARDQHGASSNGAAGQGQGQGTTSQQLNAALSKLLDSGYVIRVWAEQFRPVADGFNEAERRFKHDRGSAGLTGTKAKLELKEKINRQMRSWRDGEDEGKRNLRGIKRAYQPEGVFSYSTKRARFDHEGTNGMNGQHYAEDEDDEDVAPLDASLVVRVSHEKSVVALRNRELVNLAKHKTSATTALVYGEALRRIKTSIRRCHDPLDDPDDTVEPNLAAGPTVSTLELAGSLAPDVDLHSDIAPKTPRKRPRKRAKVNGQSDTADMLDDSPEETSDDSDSADPDDDYIDDPSLSSARRTRMQDIKKHLQLLAESTPPLLIQTGTRGLGEYAVPFDPLIRHVRLVELESLILSRFGPCALRITRILAEKGSKLDEKTISNLALVKQKEIRVTLTAMHEGGFLDLQEVPRDNSRAPSRTIYLWYYDPDRVRLRVLEDVYKCMARTLQRSRSEREALQGLLAKAERSDVKGNEETFLTNSERLALRTWGEKEERLLVQLGRLERLVGVFRDF